MSSCPHSHSCSRNCHPPIAGIDHSNLKCLEAIKLLCKNKLHELTRECGSSKIPQCHHTVNSKCKRGIHNQVHKCSLVATRKCTDQVLLKCSVGHDIFIGCSKNQTEIDALCKTCSHLKMTESHINNEQLKELQIASTEVENAQVLLAQAELEAKHQSKILNMKKKEQEAKLDVKVVRQFMAQQVSQGSMPSETCETVPKKNYQSNHVVRMPIDGDTNCVPSKEIAVPDTFHGDASLVRRYKSPEKMAQDDSTSNRLGGHSSNSHQLFNEAPSNEINENICLQESESNYNSRPQDQVFSGELFDTLMNFVEKEQWEELCNRCCDPEIDCAATQAFKVYASFMEFGDIDEALDEFKEIVPPKNYQYSNNIADLLVSCVEVIVSKNSQSYVRLIRLKNQLATSNHKFPNSFICQIDKVFNSCESCNDAETKSESTAESSTNSAQSRWESCKMEYYRVEQISEKTPSQAIDSLMDMVGLESVKLKFVDIYESVKLATEKGSSNATSYNLRCDGNPGINNYVVCLWINGNLSCLYMYVFVTGTGKTTVARLYSKLLIEVGVLPETAKFEETTGSKLICDGVRQLKSQLEALKEEGGGVIFVDEAYQFDPQNDKSGAQLLNFILPCAESLVGDYGSVVWVFAGYQKDMEKMFTFNPGLPDRFPLTLSFEDFSFSELECVFRKMMHQGASSLVKQEKVVVKEEPTNIKSKPRHWSSVKNTSSLVKDEWGNKWTPNSFADSWTDEHGNSCAYGPNNEFNRNYISSNSNDYRLGGESNPLIDKKGLIWLYDRDNQLWLQQCDRTKTKRCYPGKMQTPTKQQKIMPYEVVDEKWVRIAIRRLASMRGRVGFGNARAVRNLFDRSVERQSARITRQRREGEEPNIFMFERDDLLGPKANDTSLMNSEAYKELLAMEGLEDVKNVVNDILKLVIQNADREDNEKELLEMNLNRIFLGNPGTGKTTVAKLYGLILKNLGLLSKGELLCKASSDFVGGALGSSEILTRAILRSAEGCVLIIDEAYALNPVLGNNGGGTSDPYRAAVLDTIVEQVQGVPTEDRVVIMIGYKQEMEDMFRNSNPGLARRFQADMPVSFEDYDTKSLRRIMKSYAKKKSLRIPFETLIFAVEQVEKKKALPNFGNAGAVLNMLKKAQSNLTSRDPTSAILMKEDFSPGDKTRSLIDIFSDVSGCENIVLKLNVIEKLILNNRKRCQPVADSVPFNFLFVGAPGTGAKTFASHTRTLWYFKVPKMSYTDYPLFTVFT
jgi:AAA+ superfamily predicted ATPase